MNMAAGVVDVHVVPVMEVALRCYDEFDAGIRALQWYGCAVPGTEAWTVYVRAGLDADTFSRVYMHELAHTAGWPGDHPAE
jgi:hypothetical protein